MARVRFGLDGFVDPLQIATIAQEVDKHILKQRGPQTVKVRTTDEDGAVGQLSGFHYGEHGMVFTVAHAGVCPSGKPTVKFEVAHSPGQFEEASVKAKDEMHDVMILERGTQGSVFPAALIQPGETVYTLGMAPDTFHPAIDKGFSERTVEASFPSSRRGLESSADYFQQMFGFTESETVIIMGAHPDASGFVGRWTQDPNTLDNSFYSDMASASLAWIVQTPGRSGRSQWSCSTPCFC